MNCEDIFEKTDEYLEGWLSLEECAEFEAHIAECEVCRKGVEFAKRLNGIVNDMPSVEPPSDFLETLHKRIAAEGKTVRFYKRWQPYGALAACILVAVVIRTNMLNELNDSGSYLHSETPMPTAYSQTVQTQTDMSDANVQIAADSAADSGNAEENEAVGNVTETAMPRAAENKRGKEKTAEKTADMPVRTAVPDMSSGLAETAEKAAQPTAKTENKAVVSAPEVSQESELDNAAAGNVNTMAEGEPIARSNKDVGNMPMVYGAAVQSSAADLPPVGAVSESAAVSEKASGGSGGGSSATVNAAVSAVYAKKQANVIGAEYKDKLLKIISELGIKENDGEYTASEQEYKKLIEKLSECGIEFGDICTREGNVVRFVIEWE